MAVLSGLLLISGSLRSEPAAAIGYGNLESAAKPWNVLIRIGPARGNGTNYTWCSGSLIAERWVLTAAHCVREGRHLETVVAASRLLLFIGRRDLHDLGGSLRSADQVVSKAIFLGSGDQWLDDTALLRLVSPVPLDAEPIPLAFNASVVPPESHLVFWGYGLSERPSHRRQVLRTTLVGDWTLAPTCSGTGNACYLQAPGGSSYPAAGDSGAPVTSYVKGGWVQRGIFTGPGPIPNAVPPQYGADVVAHLAWIRSIAGLPIVAPNTIVRVKDSSASWLVGSDGFRRLIPTGSDYLCFTGRGGVPLVELSTFEVKSIPEDYNEVATCSLGPPPPDDGPPPGVGLHGPIEIISRASDGTQADWPSGIPAWSPDGRTVAFRSAATNLGRNLDCPLCSNVHLKDTMTGAVQVLDRPGPDRFNYVIAPQSISWSPDGSRIAVLYMDDIYVHDLSSGLATLVLDGVPTCFYQPSHPVWSPDSTKLAFNSCAFDLLPGDTNNSEDVFVKDFSSGSLTRVSTTSEGLQGNEGSGNPAWSPDGTKLAFISRASNFGASRLFSAEVFVKDLATGQLSWASTVASPCFGAAELVWSPRDPLLAYSEGCSRQIVITNIATGVSRIASTSAAGLPGDDGYSYSPAWSPDGSKLAFYSGSHNFVPGVENPSYQVFVKNLSSGAIELASASADGVPSDDGAHAPTWRPDGRALAFVSGSTNLVSPDLNLAEDIFIKSLG